MLLHARRTGSETQLANSKTSRTIETCNCYLFLHVHYFATFFISMLFLPKIKVYGPVLLVLVSVIFYIYRF